MTAITPQEYAARRKKNNTASETREHSRRNRNALQRLLLGKSIIDETNIRSNNVKKSAFNLRSELLSAGLIDENDHVTETGHLYLKCFGDWSQMTEIENALPDRGDGVQYFSVTH